MGPMDNLDFLEPVAALLLTDPEGARTRFWPIYRLYVAWSVRGGQLRVMGPLCMN